MNFKNFILLISFFLFISSCENSTDASDYQKVKLIDMTGFDGCGWILEVQDSSNKILDPINLNEFDIELIDKKVFYIQFHEVHDYDSICMIGEIVEIDKLKEK